MSDDKKAPPAPKLSLKDRLKAKLAKAANAVGETIGQAKFGE